MIHEFQYRVGWRARRAHPGQHAGSQAGGGGPLLGHVPLAQHPDPRHLDVRATLADPLGQLMVRQFRQRAAIPVYLVADLSASMGFRGAAVKTALLAEFAAALAWSAWRGGDPFGVLACDSSIRWELSLPLRHQPGLPDELGERLRSFRPEAANARALLEAAGHLGRAKALVFLASDFHMAEDELMSLAENYAAHDLVPVVLWDSREYADLPSFGLVELRDPETGGRRRLFLRPALRDAIRRHYAERRARLRRLFVLYGREPFFLVDHFDADAMTRYFFQS